MKKRFIFAFLASAGALALKGAVLDGIAAEVNSETITVGDVMAEIRRRPDARERFDAAANDSEASRTLYNEALESLIDRKLILKAAADKKMEMQDWVVDNRIREIVKDGFGGDRNKLDAALAESRLPYSEWRETIRQDMIAAAMRNQIVERNVQPSPAVMKAEYEGHPERYRTEYSTTVSVILLKPSDGTLPAVSTRGEEILERLADGKDFAELAREFSADSHAKDGGVWKNVKPEEAFRPEIAKEIARLKPGEHSELVNIEGWGFIVRKDSESKERTFSFAEAYNDIVRNINTEESKKRYGDWMKRLRSDAYIKMRPMPE